MEVQLKIIGVLLIVLALIHIKFPKYFNWKNELVSLSLINHQIVYVHTFFIAFAVFLIGLLCLTSSSDLVQTSLGKKVSLGIGCFWAARLFVQFFWHSAKLWKGKMLETVIHIFFSLLWAYLSVVFIIVYAVSK